MRSPAVLASWKSDRKDIRDGYCTLQLTYTYYLFTYTYYSLLIRYLLIARQSGEVQQGGLQGEV